MDRIETIAIFAAVAEQESFAEAARRLNRTPASVTRAVAELESRLQTRLLNRTTRSVSLTEAGSRTLDICRRLLAAYADLEGLNAEERAAPHGVLQVTAPANFGRLHVLPLIVSFLARYPSLDLRLLLLDRVVSLIDEGLDVGVRLGHLPDSSLRATRAGQVRQAVYASPDYLARHGTPLTPHDLGRHSTISCLALTPVPERWSFKGAGGVATVAVAPRLVVNTTDAAADAAAAGLGLAFLVSYQTDHHVKAGRLVEVLADHQLPPIPIHLVQPAGRYTPAKVRLFVDEIGQGLRRQFGGS